MFIREQFGNAYDYHPAWRAQVRRSPFDFDFWDTLYFGA
jgi:hypothetical protein